MTEKQKTDIALLVRQILAAKLPPEVRGPIINAFYCWPTELSDQAEVEDYDRDEAMQALEIVEREIELERERQDFCGICGAVPEGYLVPDQCWKHYVGTAHRFLCLPCWSQLVQRTDGGRFQDAHGRSSTLRWFGHALDPQASPLPPGGIAELRVMTQAQRDQFFDSAWGSHFWDWLDQS